jgi:uncharacterized protein YacL
MITGDSLGPSRQDTRQGIGVVFILVLRAVFALILISVGMSLVSSPGPGEETWLALNKDLIIIAFLGLALLVIAFDIWIPRKSLASISGMFFGLVVGMSVAFGLSLIVDLVATVLLVERGDVTLTAVKLAIGVICCYLCVSFILQTKDDVRFVIPYVQFTRQTKGGRPLILDTSVIIDGRIADICETRIMEAELIIPRFVLQELQMIADSGDKLKRARGRRGLDMLNRLQTSDKTDIRILDVVSERKEGVGVDEMLVDLAMELGGKVVTNDYNLNKIAQLRGVMVININDLANALKPVVLPGEALSIKVIKPGEEMGQGVGYLEDGTMVVAEGARDRIGEFISITVTSVLQTSAGRMIFGRTEAAMDRRRPRGGQEQGE